MTPTPRPTVLTVGSLHHDIMVMADHLPRRDETAVGSRWFPKFGGKGGNQAVAAARAGAESRMLGAVGADGFGAFLRAGLCAAGVDDTHVVTLPDVGSGMSVAIQDGAGDYAATIVSGANLHIPAHLLDLPDVWQGVQVLVLQNEVPAALNLAAARAAHARGLPCLLNAAPFRPLESALIPLVDLLVVNAVEAEMMGCPPVTDLDSAGHAARHLAAAFRAVVVTAGGQGLAACDAKGAAFALPAQKVAVVSTHGAGDAFVGALATALAAGVDLRAACHAASVAAGRHVAGLDA